MSKLTAKQSQALALEAQGKGLTDISKIMGNAPSNVANLLRLAHEALEDSGIESPVQAGVNAVDKLIDKSVKVFDKALAYKDGDTDGSKNRAVTVATGVLRGRGVLVDRTSIDKREIKANLQLKGDLTRKEIESFASFGFEIGPVEEAQVIANDNDDLPISDPTPLPSKPSPSNRTSRDTNSDN